MTHGEIIGTVAGLRAAFDAGATKPLAWRVRQLRALRALLTENGAELEQALTNDLGKNPTESQLAEIGFVVGEIDYALKRLRKWLRPRPVPVPGSLMPARASVVREPLGVVLIIAPWNYPVQLLLAPLVGALGGGNAVVLKPSEIAPATSRAIARLVPRYLDTGAVAVVEGAVAPTTELLSQRFDHIFYTGSTGAGRLVMAAAIKNLTPVTLELGGKSPIFVDDSVDLAVAARRIAWGKFMNAGQTCVAPDYLLATPEVARALEPHLVAAVREFFGEDPKRSPDYARIVNDVQFTRLAGLLADGRTVLGGASDASTRYFAPTILADIPRESGIMQQEIFGPILPIVTVSGVQDAIQFIREGEKPLALYVFTEKDAVRRRFLTQTSSGAIGFDVPAAHLGVPGLPFGGVGGSGFGGYHGERSLEVFTHEKAVLAKPLKPDTLRLVYPPYTERKDRFIRGLLAKLR
ncbi:MAG: aldehyde dehydrogenase [Microbacteriaceae bacterium]|nr:aldehyde dehydrogenase [Microbacteriaceae bacterium]